MLKLYLFMAAIAFVLILITANIEISGAGNYEIDIPEKTTTEPTQMFDIYGPMENNASNVVLESAENITLRQYIANEPSNQEILNQQYNKYYWAN